MEVSVPPEQHGPDHLQELSAQECVDLVPNYSGVDLYQSLSFILDKPVAPTSWLLFQILLLLLTRPAQYAENEKTDSTGKDRIGGRLLEDSTGMLLTGEPKSYYTASPLVRFSGILLSQ